MKQAQFHNGRRANGLAEWFDAFDDVIKNSSSANQKRRLSGHCEKDAVEAVALFEDFLPIERSFYWENTLRT